MLNATKTLIFLSAALLLISCATTDTREDLPTQPTIAVDSEEATAQQPLKTTQDKVEAKTEKTKRNTAEVIIGTVVGTAVAVWLVTEYIEEKIVPVVVTLVVVGLLYEASRNSDLNSAN